MELAGKVVRGYRVASGRADDPRFPEGTIRPQLPFLHAGIPEHEAYLGGTPFPGTVNVMVGVPLAVGRPEFHVRDVPWTPLFAPESFFLARARLRIRDALDVPALLYLPDPAAKPDHLQRADMLEFLACRIPRLRYGTRIAITLPDGTVTPRPVA